MCIVWLWSGSDVLRLGQSHFQRARTRHGTVSQRWVWLRVFVFSTITMSCTARATWSQWPPLGVLVLLSMPHVAFVGRYAFLTMKSCLTSHPTAPAHLHFACECLCVRCFVVLFGHGMVNSHACMMPSSNHIHTLVSINASPLHGVGPTREPKHRKNAP
jgi:hypothetical protein